MTGERIRIEGSPDNLEQLRREILDEVGDEVDIEPVSTAVPGELREPILVGLVIAFTSMTAAAVKTIGAIVERRMTHEERMEELRIYRENSDREISIAELLAERLDS